ncbi:MAG: tRNA lysidine(34) synthetase TilS, partial [Isosphaeraceae bacterium]
MEAWLAPHFHQLFTSAGPATCVVGISGGPDSVALILLLNNILPQLRLVAAHMNHHARQGADADQNFVAGLAQELGVAIEIGHFHAMRKSHFEADARKARHQWLEDVALKHQAGWVATAHTLDDQAETLLMRLARGTGPTGLAGI